LSNFITEIKIGKVRHLENIDIKLGNEKKHLILTGKNGSGKTSVLEELNKYFNYYISNCFSSENKPVDEKKYRFERRKAFKHNKNCFPIFQDNNLIKNGSFVYAFFSAKRIMNVVKPKGVNKIISSTNDLKLNQVFLQYIVNLKAEKSFARDDNDFEVADKIDNWFNKFENILKKIFQDKTLKIVFDRKEYNFYIHKKNREPFDFNGLSAGYSAIIDIITELILKIENTKLKSFDCEGIVLIDEVENHLHVELQKNILPLLTNFFPNIQFIVTTHSPFVLSSLSNSVIYDLEKQLRVEDLSGYSYDSLIESYFDSDKYSKEVKEKIEIFEKLADRDDLTDNEKDEYYKLKKYFDSLPTFMSDELAVKLNEIKLRTMFKAG